MDTTRVARLAGWAGIAYVVLAVTGTILPGRFPSPDANTAEVRRFFIENAGGMRVGFFLFGLALVGLLVFVGATRVVLRRGEGPEGLFSALFFGAGLVVAAVATVWAALIVAPSYSETLSGGAQDLIRYVWDAQLVLAGFLRFSMLVLLGAAGLAIILGRALPIWLGWLAVVAAGLQITGMLATLSVDLAVLGVIGLGASALWFLAASLVMLVGLPRAPVFEPIAPPVPEPAPKARARKAKTRPAAKRSPRRR